MNMVAELRERGIGFASLHENLDTTTPGGRLVFHVFAALAEFIRELIVIGIKEGFAATRGRVGGRPSVATEEIIRAARDQAGSWEGRTLNLTCPPSVLVYIASCRWLVGRANGARRRTSSEKSRDQS
ncbi:recombinase family protein [Streptomyces iakyrus]|uniref:recombinase family protein n=1 Tax=Streptomyces iakyrus TaxID=68219 RepID=UPI0036EB1583